MKMRSTDIFACALETRRFVKAAAVRLRRYCAAGTVLFAALAAGGCLWDGSGSSSSGAQHNNAASGAGAPGVADKAGRPTLRATFRDVPPDMLTYSAARHSGPLRYVVEEAAAQAGYAVEWTPAPFAESFDKAVRGEVDIVPFVRFKTAEREKFLRFSESLGKVMTYTYFLQHADDKQPIKMLDDLRGRTVGYRPGSYYYAEFLPDNRFQKVGYPNDAKMIKGFIDRKVDVVVVNVQQAAERVLAASGYSASNYKYAELVIARPADMYLLFSRAPELQAGFDRIDQALLKMREEGVIEDIYKSFDTPPPQRRVAPE